MADNNLGGLGEETLRNAQGIRASIDDIQDSTTRMSRALNESTRRYSDLFKTVRDSANKVAEIQSNAVKTSKATGEALGQQAKQLGLVRNLNVQIDELYIRSSKETGDTKDNLLRQAQNLAEARDNAKELASVYGSIARDASKLDGKTKFFTKLSEIAKSIPILNKLSSPFEKAAEAARQVAFEQAKVSNIVAKEDRNGKMRYYDTSTGKAKRITDAEGQAAIATQKQSPTKAAMGALGGELMGSLTSMTSLVGIVATIAKFIWEIFAGAQENTIKIAKNLGISRDSANQMRLHFIDIATNSDNILVNSKSLIEAQSALVDNLGVYTKLQDSTLTNQVFLTETLKLSGDAASDLNLLFESQGQNAEVVTDSMNKTNNAAAKATGIMVPFNKLMTSVAKTSLEIKGYFGFNAKAIAEGVRQVSKFGLELSNAASISKTLLDFESSIGNELTLELLTGKEFNLEKARSKALTGDIAGATADVMQQMQGLTEEQRKNPLIMESMAAMSGLSADQINRAYLINKKLTKEQRDYVEQLQKAGKEKEANNATDMAMNGATIADMKRQLTVSDAFTAAMDKLKDKLGQLDQNGALDTLTDAIIDFSKWIGEITGKNAEIAGEQAQSLAAKGILSKDQAAKLSEEAEGQSTVGRWTRQIGDWFNNIGERNFGLRGSNYEEEADRQRDLARSQLAGRSQGNTFGTAGASGGWGTESNPAKTKDFVIKPLDKDTISMAGGTKLGGNVEALLQDLISAVRGDKHIYIGANSVTEAIGVHTNRVGNT